MDSIVDRNKIPLFTDRLFVSINTLFRDVMKESYRQVSKHGVQTKTIYQWISYLAEEVGELAKAVNDYSESDGDKNEIRSEAIQVATLALKIAEMTEV